MRKTFPLFLVLAIAPAALVAQDAGAPPPPDAPVEGCVLNPSPDCRYFGVTDIGLAFGPRRQAHSYFTPEDDTDTQMTIEGGVMRNLSARNAAGLTWFFALDKDNVLTGPGGRYRRWLTRRQSLDVGLSVPVPTSTFRNGTILGLLRYSPDPFIGVSVRPERLSYSTLVCDRTGCRSVTHNEVRVLVGGDLSGKPGSVIMAAYGIATGVVLLLLVATLHG